jgi:sugar transferase (PEP-CTERM/EpsH1 system associated)
VSGEILFLAHRIPFPPDRGDKIRSHNILKGLAELAPVHVACFAETEADRQQIPAVASLAASHCVVNRTKPLALAGLEALIAGKPISLTAFCHPAIARFVARTISEHAIDAIYVFSGQMGQYVPAGWRGRVIVDLGDVDSAKFGAYATDAAWPLSGLYRREDALMRTEEERLAHMADHTLLISEAEAALLQSRLVDPDARIAVLGNGVDFAAFDPASIQPHPALSSSRGPHLVFTGQMDYPPNVAAARRVAHAILPGIRKTHPAAQFHVVGRAPSAEVRALATILGVRVWGEVPAVQPFLAAADIVLAPLAIARGVQNKVLEAMAMARPVLLTPEAATGIEASDPIHFAVAESDQAIIARALQLLADPQAAGAMGGAARRFVTECMSWPAMLAPLPALLGREARCDGQRDAA